MKDCSALEIAIMASNKRADAREESNNVVEEEPVGLTSVA